MQLHQTSDVKLQSIVSGNLQLSINKNVLISAVEIK